MKQFVILAALALAACAGKPPIQQPEPVVVTKEVLVPTPVPCKALEKLGPEPVYADTNEALASAPGIFDQTKLLLVGRLQRIQRGTAMEAARLACIF